MMPTAYGTSDNDIDSQCGGAGGYHGQYCLYQAMK